MVHQNSKERLLMEKQLSLKVEVRCVSFDAKPKPGPRARGLPLEIELIPAQSLDLFWGPSY